MAAQKRSLRNLFNYILVVLCVFALMLVWFTVEQYQGIVISEQRNSNAALIAHVVSEQLKLHESYLIDLGMSMQTDHKFRIAYTARDIEILNSLIADQFHQYFVTTGLVDLKRITIYDAYYNVVTEVDGDAVPSLSLPVCRSLLARAKLRQGTERNKPLGGVCQQHGNPYQTAIIPIGSLRIEGYAAITADPVHSLEQIKNLPENPYSISLPAGQVLFRAAGWPVNSNADNTLIAQYTIDSDGGDPLLVVSAASDISSMEQRLTDLMRYIGILVLSVMMLFIYLTRLLFDKRLVLPLMKLKQHMVMVQHNQDALGKNVDFSTCRELDELAREFNSMVDKLFEAQRELHIKALTDALTGLPNREALYDRLGQTAAVSRRKKRRFGLLMIDLNGFKSVNDTMGHHAGDELIRLVGMRIAECLRASDTVARLGGDEFAVLLPTSETNHDVVEVAKKIIEHCAIPYLIDGIDVHIGLSIGIAIYPDTAEDSDFLMRCADKSMYQAKQSRSGYSLSEPQCAGQTSSL